MPSPLVVALAARIYRLFLIVYPQAFRRAYAAPMTQLFRDCCRAAVQQRGLAGLAPLWGRTLQDLVTSGLRERAAGVLGRSWIPPALRAGAIMGLFLIVSNTITNLAPIDSPLQSLCRGLFPLFLFVIMPVAYGLAGARSGQRSRTARTGTYAGLLTACICSATMISSLLLVMLLFWDTVRTNALHDPGMIADFYRSHAPTFDRFVLTDNLGAALVATLVSLLYGAILGTVGGLLGARWPDAGSNATGGAPS